MRPLRRLVPILLVLAAFVALPRGALADGDPASDVLLLQDDYVPYAPAPAPPLARGLAGLLQKTKRAGFELKVAVIDSPQDLGSVPNMFGMPQQYAQFLAAEIAFNTKKPLLVSMPGGFGLAGVTPAEATAVAHLTPPAAGTDALVRSALSAVVALSRAAGHPVAAPSIPSVSGRSGSGSVSPALVFGAPVALLALAGGLAALRRRSSTETESGVGPGA